MAGAVTHIVLADKVFEKYFRGKDKKDFYVGTCFPDIRYLGIIPREKTHYNDLNVETLAVLPAFEAGLRFHSLVDLVRGDFVVSRNVYSLIPESPFITQALKFFEDKMLFSKRGDWDEIVSYFDAVTADELSFGLKQSDIEKWHKYLRLYFSIGPCDESIRTYIAEIGRPREMAEEMIRLANEMERNTHLQETVSDFYNGFGELLR